jgi:hypothetical protein
MTGLNGWQRIGIVLSIIWLIGFGAYNWRYEEQFGEYSSDYSIKALLNTRFDRARYQCRQNWVVQSDLKEKDNPFARYSDEVPFEVRKRCFDESHGIYLTDMFAVGFGIVVFCWLFAWSITVVTRWVGRGFA